MATELTGFRKQAGRRKLGVLKEELSVKNRKRSSLTAVLSGACLAFQSGISSSSARGSITAPDRMCAPTSEPFSSTHTGTPGAACFARIAAARAAGAAPTTTQL